MEKLCIFCKHFYLDMGYPDLSDVTPGSPTVIWCNKKCWEMNYNFDTERDFRQYMLMARNCKHYEYLPIEEIGK